MGFAKSDLFNSQSTPHYEPFEPVSTMRDRFSSDTKVLFAIGGWGDTEGFAAGAKDDTSRQQYAKNVAAVVKENGFDGVDIDWEYPGGNGDNYKDIPNEEKTGEIDAFPKLLEAIKKELPEGKILSIATPGKKGDMIAYTDENGPKIAEAVDMVNVMSYDLANRRNKVTKHHSSVEDSRETIKAFKGIGLPADKLNLGFAYYAKWFMTAKDADCKAHPLGCEMDELETPDGKDTGKSGALTFEKGTMATPNKDDLKESTDGSCGYSTMTTCPSGQCCSQYGTCGTTDAHCQAGCLSDYGICKGLSIIDSWRRADKNGQLDEKAGGQYYFDDEENLFWTWDTPDMIKRKFKDVVDEEKIGGVMAWSLGEDTLDFAHVKAMQDGVKERNA
ncbi:uncharacterized protein ASPGLDRAFT_47153 [Aspergillus glaucus CBS 516.65]|uniref:chitinase n=1 Tax=Aspergillus glaucus CBS 516.65 TaxID=1160497 RepID=A0A1L9VK97_ASPGL|nr:hypothetical protein ASPGLDRAFT_47153 [Aspergillus glaucus CBS 516.65]OJJ84300.1 hypothetical protein ASPGLDRAFT_47153 [Aspergillus glaucus CBS 516.65]